MSRHSVFRTTRIPVITTTPVAYAGLHMSLPSDNPAQLPDFLAHPSAPTAAPYVTVANDPDPAVPARDIPRTAASTTALFDGHPPIDKPNTPPIFREDITPSSPTESGAEFALRDWNPPPRSYHSCGECILDQLLLENGAEAASSEGHEATVKLLLENGARPPRFGREIIDVEGEDSGGPVKAPLPRKYSSSLHAASRLPSFRCIFASR
jgi:hypothetical protein